MSFRFKFFYIPWFVIFGNFRKLFSTMRGSNFFIYCLYIIYKTTVRIFQTVKLIWHILVWGCVFIPAEGVCFQWKQIISFMICNNFSLFINIYIWDINPYYDIVTFVGTFHMLTNIYITIFLTLKHINFYFKVGK
jgi:hypothetical protein